MYSWATSFPERSPEFVMSIETLKSFSEKPVDEMGEGDDIAKVDEYVKFVYAGRSGKN